jgi:ubiquinone/menaquinone biosynthesis C-methylase UbiE/uncharacterized protein YbaR (Trm112 family)
MRRWMRRIASASGSGPGLIAKPSGILLLAFGLVALTAGASESGRLGIAIVCFVTGTVVASFAFVIPIVVRFRGRTRVRDQVLLTILPPKRVPEGWLLRLRVQKLGSPATLQGEVGPRHGSQTDARASCALQWRHHSGTHHARLGWGGAEVLRVAIARTRRPNPELVLLSVGDENGRPRFPIGPNRLAVIPLRIVDIASDKIVREESVSVSFSEHDHVPTIEFAVDDAQKETPEVSSQPVPADTGRSTDTDVVTEDASGPSVRPTVPQVEDSSTIVSLAERKLTSEEVHHLQDVLRCSVCGSLYEVGEETLTCTGCGLCYPVIDGVPVLKRESTIETKLEKADYDAVHRITAQRISRDGATWKELIERLGLQRECAAEIGAGTGSLTLGLLQQKAVGRLTATDVSEKFLRILNTRVADYETPVSLVACDANERHFRSEAFDLVLGRAILHHLLDYDLTLRTCHHMLKKGGTAVFFEPILEGKIIVATMMALMLRYDHLTNGGTLSPVDRKEIRKLINNYMKSKLYPQDRESLSLIEDKYIFAIDEMRRVGLAAGFAEVDYINNDFERPSSYWPFVREALLTKGISQQRIERYKWIDGEFANTYGLMFADKLIAPMGFFVFRK